MGRLFFRWSQKRISFCSYFFECVRELRLEKNILNWSPQRQQGLRLLPLLALRAPIRRNIGDIWLEFPESLTYVRRRSNAAPADAVARPAKNHDDSTVPSIWRPPTVTYPPLPAFCPAEPRPAPHRTKLIVVGVEVHVGTNRVIQSRGQHRAWVPRPILALAVVLVVATFLRPDRWKPRRSRHRAA